MKLCIADPPYLGVSALWYGDPEGATASNKSTLSGGARRKPGKADAHPDAHLWDQPEAHERMVQTLVREYDGWAVAMKPSSLWQYLQWAPQDVCHIAAWTKRRAMPTGSRPFRAWEPVLIRVPDGRRRSAPNSTLVVKDWINTAGPDQTTKFAGQKPREWTRWVLDMLGYDPEADTVDDLFHGSGAVAAEIAQGVLL